MNESWFVISNLGDLPLPRSRWVNGAIGDSEYEGGDAHLPEVNPYMNAHEVSNRGKYNTWYTVVYQATADRVSPGVGMPLGCRIIERIYKSLQDT